MTDGLSLDALNKLIYDYEQKFPIGERVEAVILTDSQIICPLNAFLKIKNENTTHIIMRQETFDILKDQIQKANAEYPSSLKSSYDLTRSALPAMIGIPVIYDPERARRLMLEALEKMKDYGRLIKPMPYYQNGA